jgi:hypothetical protein
MFHGRWTILQIKNPGITGIFCGTSRSRTSDTRIFSPLLYQLSYGTRAFGSAKIVQKYLYARKKAVSF